MLFEESPVPVALYDHDIMLSLYADTVSFNAPKTCPHAEKFLYEGYSSNIKVSDKVYHFQCLQSLIISAICLEIFPC